LPSSHCCRHPCLVFPLWSCRNRCHDPLENRYVSQQCLTFTVALADNLMHHTRSSTTKTTTTKTSNKPTGNVSHCHQSSVNTTISKEGHFPQVPQAAKCTSDRSATLLIVFQIARFSQEHFTIK
jgi:hypothetical protein